MPVRNSISIPRIQFSTTKASGQNLTPVIVKSGGSTAEWLIEDGTWKSYTGNTPTIPISNNGTKTLVLRPAEIYDNITQIDINSDNMSGNLPVAAKLLTNLAQFRCQINQFTGSLPAEYAALINLSILRCDSNQLTGSLPSAYSAWVNLSIFQCQTNQFTGSLPSAYSAWVNLTQFRCSSNQFTGSLPSAYSAWVNLTLFYCFSNQITGVEANSLDWPRIEQIRHDDNSMTTAALDFVVAEIRDFETGGGYVKAAKSLQLQNQKTGQKLSAAGVADVTYLQANGWTVTYSV